MRGGIRSRKDTSRRTTAEITLKRNRKEAEMKKAKKKKIIANLIELIILTAGWTLIACLFVFHDVYLAFANQHRWLVATACIILAAVICINDKEEEEGE